MSEHRDILLTDTIEGEQLAEVNRVLRWHGVKEVGPCQVQEVMQHLTPMEMGRYGHILHEITLALDATNGIND